MKRFAVLIISLLLAFSAFVGTTAFAEESSTIYPQDKDFIKTLTFSNLTDYQVEDGIYYFAEGEAFYKFEDGELSENKPEEFTFAAAQSEVSTDKYYYYLHESGSVTVLEKSSASTVTFEGKYSKLKLYANKAYAVKENCLYAFEGTRSPEKIALEYSNYSITRKIIVGQAASALKNYSSLAFVNITAGAYMTAIDLTSLDGEFFKLEKSDKLAENTVRAQENAIALLLCYTGNAAIVAIGDRSFILLKTNTHEAEVNCFTEKEFDNATIIGGGIYASPYVITGTSAVANAPGTIVSVLNKLEYEGVLGSVYYEVMYLTESGTAKVGYVADGLLTEYIIEDNKKPSVIPDPGHSESDNVKTVLLVLAVVVLVLIAFGYLAYIGTSDKRKKKAKEKEQKQSPSNE